MLSATYAESLLALGIVPHSVLVVPLLLPEHQRKVFERHGVKMIPVRQYIIDFQAIQADRTQFIVSPMISEGTRRHLMTIAPVAIGFAADMMGAISQLAVLFRREREAERVYAAISAAAAEARNQLADVIRTRATVMVLRVEPNQYRYLGQHAKMGSSQLFYTQLGLNTPPYLADAPDWFTSLSAEVLPEVDPDYIFIEQRAAEGMDSTESWNQLMESSLWKGLKPVKEGKVFPLATNDFVQGEGPVGYSRLIDYIVSSLIPGSDGA